MDIPHVLRKSYINIMTRQAVAIPCRYLCTFGLDRSRVEVRADDGAVYCLLPALGTKWELGRQQPLSLPLFHKLHM